MDFSLYEDLCSIQLTVIGISFSIFTIIYSIILIQKDKLNLLSKQIKTGSYGPENKQLEYFCIKNIKSLRRINLFTIAICSASISICISMWILKYFELPNGAIITIYIVNFLDLGCILILIIRVFKSYFKQTKID